MSKLKSSVKTAVVSTLALTSTAAIIYAVPKIIETQSSDIGNKLKLDVEKIDSDTVKVSIDNIQDIPKSIQFSIKLAGDVELNDGEASIRDLITPEVKTRLANNEYKEESNNILADYTYNQESNTIDVLITSDNSLPKTGNKIEVLELDVKALGGNSGTTYQVVPSNEDEYKYLSITNKEYSNLGVVSDNEVITMNTAPTITASKDFIKILEGEVLELNAQNLGITMEDKDGDEVKLEVKDLSQSSKPVITEFSKNTPGVYSIECVAIDSNKESSEPVVLQVYVDYDNITELPTITKNGEPLKSTITINGGDIFKPLENVVAVDAKGRELEVQVSSDKELNLDPENDITYVLTYRAIDSYGNEAIVEVNLKVIANKAPVISGVKNHTLKVGDKFDPEDGVTVIDEDDDIELIVESNVNTNIAGEYRVSYSATDSKGKTTRVQSKVIVNEKMSSINSIPVITAGDMTVKLGDKFDPISIVSAYDKEDGDLTSKVKVVENNLDINKEGQYKIKFSVTDSKGATATKTITITVIKDVELAQSIIINDKFKTINLGETKEISATVNKEADLKDVEWSISDSSVASLQVEGNIAKITAKSEGKVTITATTVDGSNLSDSFEVTVSDDSSDGNSNNGNTSGDNDSSDDSSNGNSNNGNTSGDNDSSEDNSDGNSNNGNTSEDNDSSEDNSGGNSNNGNTSGNNGSSNGSSGGSSNNGNTSGDNSSSNDSSNESSNNGNTSEGNTSSNSNSNESTDTSKEDNETINDEVNTDTTEENDDKSDDIIKTQSEVEATESDRKNNNIFTFIAVSVAAFAGVAFAMNKKEK